METSRVTVSEGALLTMNCTYTCTGYPTLFWYVQYLRKVCKMKKKGRVSATINRKERHSSLHITASQPRDSATYFCAVETHVTTGGAGYGKLTFGQGTTLTVHPNIQNPNPAVYQLRSPKSSNTSVCLYTDFESQANVSQVTRPVVFSSDSTVLDMGALGSKSNGVVAWSSGTDLGCADTFNQTFYPNSGECRSPCDAKIAEKSFETDMNLNFQNLSVIGFRVLLLKVVGYNLLMTLRLWSS
uniref:Ig-like domain-containing protein n=1 Tax=Phocoena sinus TaxID=42100 RepID=A0A8C9CEH0_PHOSS